MEPMFEIDMKDYDGTERIKKKTAARGIIFKGKELALVYSRTFGYYKFPGGGVEKGETLTDALIREVREESGLAVIPESIKEYGMSARKEKGRWTYMLDQDSYFFTCDVSDEVGPQELSENETIADFVLEYVSPEVAIAANEEFLTRENNGAIIRDTRVMRMLTDA